MIGMQLARILPVSSFASRLECSFAGPCLMAYGKFGQPYPAVALHGLFSALKRVNCLCCMALSRRPSKRALSI